MGGITKTLFGGSDSSQKQESSAKTTFDVKRTPYSTFSGDTLTLDPTIRSLQEETLSGYRGFLPELKTSFGDFTSRLTGARDTLTSASAGLKQARLSPLQEAIARRRGELYQSTGERGLAGSSFQDQAISNFELDAARQLGEASALADADVLERQTGIDKDILNAIIGKVQIEANLLGLPANIAQQRLQEELAAFNLGKGNVSTNIMTGSQDTTTGMFPALGSLFSGYGAYKKAG